VRVRLPDQRLVERPGCRARRRARAATRAGCAPRARRPCDARGGAPVDRRGEMTRAFRAAAVQMVSGGDVDRNLEQAASLVADAAGDGADLVLLPEYFGIL